MTSHNHSRTEREREINEKKKEAKNWCETSRTAKLLRLEWLIGKRGFIKFFSSPDPRRSAHLDIEYCGVSCSGTGEGSFIQQKCFFLRELPHFVPPLEYIEMRKDFPAFGYSCCALWNFTQSFSTNTSFFFVFWWKNKPDQIQQHWVALYTVKNEIGRAREADAESFFFLGSAMRFSVWEKKL